jgi:nucleotide-binding universal stress UspA family protein
MSLRDLACTLEATEQPSRAALEQALALARGYGAHLSVLVLAPEIVLLANPFDVAMVTGLAAEENTRVRGRADALAKTIRDSCVRDGVACDVRALPGQFYTLKVEMVAHARRHDLSVIDRPGGLVDKSEIVFEEILFGSGRPVIVAAPERKPVEKIGKIAIAWDGSAHAARALSMALGLFADIKQADIVVVAGEKDLSGTIPGTEIAAHVSRHGIKTTVTDLRVEKGGVAATLDAHAAKAGADIIVMGGFGHSRLREFILGGVTRELTRSARTALLLAH